MAVRCFSSPPSIRVATSRAMTRASRCKSSRRPVSSLAPDHAAAPAQMPVTSIPARQAFSQRAIMTLRSDIRNMRSRSENGNGRPGDPGEVDGIAMIGPRMTARTEQASKIDGEPMRNSLAPVLALAVSLGAGCARSAPVPPPETEVLVRPVLQQDVPIISEWIGTLDGSVNAAIRPKVEGYLRRQLYKEGQYVKPGDPLFEIDPRQFR